MKIEMWLNETEFFDKVGEVVKKHMEAQTREEVLQARDETKADAYRSGQPWNDKEVSRLKSEWVAMITEIAFRHGRTYSSIAGKYKQLRKTDWNPYY